MDFAGTFSELLLPSPLFAAAFLPSHSPIFKMSYTPESLEETLQKYDDIIKNGIMQGDIQQVMKDIDSELVWGKKKIHYCQ